MDNEKKLNRLGLIIKLVVAVPALFFTFFVMTSGISVTDSSQLEISNFLTGVGLSGFSFSAATTITIIAIFLALALVLFFFITLLINRPKEALRSIAGILIAGVIFVIIYLVGTTDTAVSLHLQEGLNPTQGQLDFTNAGLWTSIIVLAISILITIFMKPIMNLLKK